jgi:hypothetical protein
MSSNDMPAAPLTGSTSGNTKKRSRGSGSPSAEGSEEEHPRNKRLNCGLSPINSDTEVAVVRQDTLVNRAPANDNDHRAPANDEDHNYSITRRWKNRNTAWEEWSAALCVGLDRPYPCSEPELRNALDTFEGVCKKKLFMTFEGKSPLGLKLLAFKKFVADNLGKIIAKHAAEKNELETKLKDPGADISVLNTIIELKNELNEAAILTAFIAMVSEKHLALRSKLSVTKSKGNETAGMSFCTLPSDSRITQPQQASPAPVDDIDPVIDQALTTSLAESVGQLTASIHQSFHGYAVHLFEKSQQNACRSQHAGYPNPRNVEECCSSYYHQSWAPSSSKVTTISDWD